MNIAILGSSFDPPHNGHLEIAKSILRSKIAQKVILMPTYVHPFGKKMTPFQHRLTMAKLLEEEKIQVSDLEIKKNSTSYSIDTLKALQKLFPKDKFVWIIGSDNINDFTKWKDWQEIIEEFGLIVVPRYPENSPRRSRFATPPRWLERLLGGESRNIIVLTKKNFSPIDISSSEIRKRVKQGKSISLMVPKEIEKYIIKHGLYL